MQQKQRLWRQRSFIVALCTSVLGLGLVGYLLYLGYQVPWTGFSVPACPANQQCPSYKTVWDWLQLFVVPLALAGAGFWFSQAQKKTELNIAQKHKETEQNIALDKQREDLLQAYLDRMSDLLLEKDLRQSAVDAEVRNVARVRTLTVLSQLDSLRKNYVLSFLREAKLVSAKPGESFVSFSQADMKNMDLKKVYASNLDLSGANLSGANLSEANLNGANLSEANLYRANLGGADLFGANLSEANLNGANLSKANLYRANLGGASFNKANLGGADLSKANLSEAFLDNANLSKAYLFQTDLSKAKLSGAKLSGAKFSGTNLSEADLSGADLSETNAQQASNITEEQLKQAKVH